MYQGISYRLDDFVVAPSIQKPRKEVKTCHGKNLMK